MFPEEEKSKYLQSLEFRNNDKEPGMTNGYSFYAELDSPWDFRVRKEICSALNEVGFKHFFVGKVNEPEFAKGQEVYGELKSYGPSWVAVHQTDSSQDDLGNDYGTISLIDDLRHDVEDLFMGGGRSSVNRDIREELDDDTLFDDLEPRLGSEDKVFEVFRHKISEFVQTKKQQMEDEHPGSWEKLVARDAELPRTPVRK